MSIYLSSAYLAPVCFFSKLVQTDSPVYIEKYENYVKQTYRNRCTILSANGVMPLSVPVEGSKGLKCSIVDICVSEHGNWRHLHWNALISAYNSTPFFQYYEDDFRPFYEKKYKYLFDFTEGLREMVCGLIDIDTSRISYTNEFIPDIDPRDSDYRYSISPKTESLKNDPHFVAVPYYQVFGQRFEFTENLSIVDLLFNMGPESLLILNKCIKKTF